MGKLLVFAVFLSLIGGVAAVPSGEAHILDNPGQNDYVEYHLNGSVNGSALEKTINSSGIDVTLDSVGNEDNLTKVKFKLGIGEKTGLLSRKVDLDELSGLNVSRAGTLLFHTLSR